jgi:hypothetical protein
MAASPLKAITYTATGAGTTTFDFVVPESPTASAGTIAVNVLLTASSGTPTLDVKVLWSADGVTFTDADAAVDSLAQITTAVGKSKQFTVKGKFGRVSSVIAGTTPTFTGTIWVTML